MRNVDLAGDTCNIIIISLCVNFFSHYIVLFGNSPPESVTLRVAVSNLSNPITNRVLQYGSDVVLCYEFRGNMNKVRRYRLPCLRPVTASIVAIQLSSPEESGTLALSLNEVEINPGETSADTIKFLPSAITTFVSGTAKSGSSFKHLSTGHYYDLLGEDLSYISEQKTDDTNSRIIILEQAVVRAGHLVSLRAYIEHPDEKVYFQLWRPVVNGSNNMYKLICQSELSALSYGEVIQSQSCNTLVEEGDRVGLQWPGNATVPYENLRNNMTNAFQVLVAENQDVVHSIGDIIQTTDTLYHRRYHFSANILSPGKYAECTQ